MIINAITRQFEVANEIARQLGGARALRLMLGASSIIATTSNGNPALSFSFKGSRMFNKCVIELNEMDEYTMTLSRQDKFGQIKKSTTIETWCGSLAKDFTLKTGLDLAIPKIVFA